MNRRFPFDDEVSLGLLLRLIGRASERMGRALEARETAAPEEIREAENELRRQVQELVTAGGSKADVEAAAKKLLISFEEAARGLQPAPAAGSRAAPPGPAEGSEVRPGRDRPGRDRPGRDRPGRDRPGRDRPGCDRHGSDRQDRAAPNNGPPAGGDLSAHALLPPANVPSESTWRRGFVLPEDEAPAEAREIVHWLELEIAARTAKGQDATAGTLRRPAGPSSVPAPGEQAQGDPKDRAVQSIRHGIGELARTLPRPIRPLVEETAKVFCDPAARVFRMRRETGATDWTAAMFKKELGFSVEGLKLSCRVELALLLCRDTSLSVRKIAMAVGYSGTRPLEKLFNRRCGFSPSQARTYLRRVRADLRDRCDEILDWRFWVRHRRGELELEDLRAALVYFRDRFGPR